MFNLKYNFVSYADLLQCIERNMWKVPRDVDLVVGNPRSGMIPAYALALYMNCQVSDLHSFADNKFIRHAGHGVTRAAKRPLDTPMDAKKILLVDDSYWSGYSMSEAHDLIRESGFKGEIIKCAAIVAPEVKDQVDLHFMEVGVPRIFEWNLFHHKIMGKSCVAFEGVICRDGGKSGRNGADLDEAVPLHIPTAKIANIISDRPKNARPDVEEWLSRQGVSYENLHFVGNAPQFSRRQAKSRIFRYSQARLYVDGADRTAKGIASLTGRPVISVETMRLHNGQGIYLHNIHAPDSHIDDLRQYRAEINMADPVAPVRRPFDALSDLLRPSRKL